MAAESQCRISSINSTIIIVLVLLTLSVAKCLRLPFSLLLLTAIVGIMTTAITVVVISIIVDIVTINIVSITTITLSWPLKFFAAVRTTIASTFLILLRRNIILDIATILLLSSLILKI